MIFDDRDVPMSWHEVENFQVVFGQEKELPQLQVILMVEHDRKNYKLKERETVQPIIA